MTDIKLIIIAGCGALGSRIAIDIARPDIPMVLIDHDRVKEENITTSIYTRQHISALKTATLGVILYNKFEFWYRTPSEYHKTVNSELFWISAVSKVSDFTIPFSSQILIIDSFDNIEARSYTVDKWEYPDWPNVLHVSVGLHNIGAVEWDEVYKLPETNPDEDICTHMAGRDLIVLTSAVAIRMANLFLDTGEKRSAIVSAEPKVMR